MNKTIDTVNKTRIGVSVILITISIVLLFFTLISGSEEYGSTFSGIVQNSPNATPWVVLLIGSLIGYKRPVFGGFLVFMIGLGMFFFFNFQGNFFFTTFIISLIIPLFGFLLLMCGYYLKKADEK